MKFYHQLTDIILLSAPAKFLAERLRTRPNIPCGKRLEELEEVFYYLETVEPLLRRGATCEIKTTIPLDQVVDIDSETVFAAGDGNVSLPAINLFPEISTLNGQNDTAGR